MTYVHRIGRTARAGASGHRDHARRLGRHPALEADLRQARPAVPRAGRDLLDLAAPLPRTRHPARGDRARCRAPSAPAPAWTPSSSRTSAAASPAKRHPPAPGRLVPLSARRPNVRPARRGPATAPEARSVRRARVRCHCSDRNRLDPLGRRRRRCPSSPAPAPAAVPVRPRPPTEPSPRRSSLTLSWCPACTTAGWAG